MSDTDEAQDALRAAREAVRVANEALRPDEQAVGIDHGDAPRPANVIDELRVKQIKLDDLEAAGPDGRAEVSARYFADAPPGGISRVVIARSDDGAARIVLRDGQGRDRIRLTAPASGSPSIEILDERGSVQLLA